MLEVVDVSAHVHIYLVPTQDGVHPLLHVRPLLRALGRVGIDGMVSHHHHPVLTGSGQFLVQPCQLSVGTLLPYRRVVLRVVVVLVYQGCGVEEYHPHAGAVPLEHLAVVACRHLPSAAHLRIVQHRLRVPPVLMVAQDGVPGNLQFRVTVDEFVVGHPQRVIHTLHSHEMMHVPQCQHRLEVMFLGHAPHEFRYRLLFVVAVTPHIVSHQQRYLRGRYCCLDEQQYREYKPFHFVPRAP